jgi:hypothetical protein
MSLNKQTFRINFSQGVDTKTDDKQVIAGKMLALENGVLTKAGKVIKKNGNSQVASALDQGVAIATFQNELLAFDNTNSYSLNKSNNSWVDRGSCPSIALNSFPVLRNTYVQENVDSCIHSSGLQLFVWDDSRGGVRYSAIDKETGTIIVSDLQISIDGSLAKPIAIGNLILVFYYDSGISALMCVPIPVSAPGSMQSAFQIATDVSIGSINFDACLLSQRVFIAYSSTSTSGSTGILYVNSFLQISTTLYVLDDSNVSIGLIPDMDLSQLYLVMYDGTNLKFNVTDYNLSAFAGSSTTIESVSNVKNITGTAQNGLANLLYTIENATPSKSYIKKCSVNNSLVAGSPAVFIRSVSLCGKAFLQNSLQYVPTVFDTSLQPTIFLLDESAVVTAKISPQLAGGATLGPQLSNTNVQNSEVMFAYTKKDLLDSVAGDIYTQAGVYGTRLYFSQAPAFQKAQLGNNLHTAGAILQMYDGISFVEHSFNYYPEDFSNSISLTGGSISAGTRQYVVTYEWIDNQSQLHRSTTSVPLSVVNTGATSKNTLTIPTLRLTQKKGGRSSVSIVVYRTVNVGTTFYQITSSSSPLFNNTLVDTVTYDDTQSDASIIGNNLLYTLGGVIDNTQAPSCDLVTTFKNRLIYIPSEDPYSYGYSKQIAYNTPVEFFDQQATQVDQRGGPITSLGSLDDKLILFKESSIFAITGDGPNNTGAQNDFSDPQLITTDGGCSNQNSVVQMPLGLMYKSKKGIYALDRGLNLSYIGKDVEAYNHLEVLSSTLISEKNQVRFSLESGVLLVYDYLLLQWSIFTNYNNIIDSVNFENRYTWVKTTGKVLSESDDYNDDGNYIKLKIKTSWFSLADIQGFQRIYKIILLGNYVSRHLLQISACYDFNPDATFPVLIDAYDLLNEPSYGITTPYGKDIVYGGTYPLYQFRYQMERQKCEAIQIIIEDFQSSTQGEGYQMSSLAFEVGVKSGLNKITSNRTFS